ncbi:hypothetical protein ACWDWS_02425 [Streptomyces sp. NPDC003328]
MPELSFPYDANNETGGSQVVSQTQWQQMANTWTTDHIDFSLSANTYASPDLPLNASINGRNVTMQPGSAWVGGFYYQLTGTKTLTIADNNTNQGRIDMIVLRADMAKSSVNLAVVQGTPASTPAEPKMTRQLGGIWEMPLHAATVPANNGTVVLNRRSPFAPPKYITAPFNASQTNNAMPRYGFVFDANSTGGGSQAEGFSGRDGYVTTRHFGKSITYTPNSLYTEAVPAANRRGRWRWIAPNVFWFEITIVNDFETGINLTGSNTVAAVSLPMAANLRGFQACQGVLRNPDRNGGRPNLMDITAVTQVGSTVLYLYSPNYSNLAEGLDGLRGYPANSQMYVSGVVEAAVFTE